MSAKYIKSARRRLFGNTQQLHMDLFHAAPSFAVIAVRAGCYNVGPDVLPAHMARRHMVYGEIPLALSAILTSIIVAAKDLTTGQLDVRTWPMNLIFQPDYGRAWQ